MSVEHLNFLRKALEADHWVVVKETPGNDYSISGYWYLSRPNGDAPFRLAFEGLNDLEVLPIDKAYGCYVVDNKEIALYFGKVGRSFLIELPKFIEALSRVHT